MLIEREILHVDGMSCDHCIMSIKKALMGLEGVESVEVSLEEKTVTVTYDTSTIDVESIKEAIDEEGYIVID